MGPTKPTLRPLTTPKSMVFPSELRERTFTTCLDPDRSSSIVGKGTSSTEDNEASITPPPAYTDFVNTFSPIFSSPTTSRANFYKYMVDKPRHSPTSTTPSSTTSTNFPSGQPSKNNSTTAVVPHPAHGQRMRLPPPYVCTPVSDSPRSAHPLHSPFTSSEYRGRPFESPVSEAGNSFSVRHVVTTTITYKRAPQLDAPPLGKKRKNLKRRNT
ncbi:uncharacterized protein BO87DRAFT_85776 [Aspergillus neoniger CBS 115656]|uniref:Uncharacterized protein n=1 Tax=Aspergillus neoniger (strain CBS 115656) TaxID=1448310 RepID=A0A318YKV1_ASPNB|nr:hypothetical protein BO87DRAFT_85776 [Aspergillus neoniger CBS 115656]PYH33273.1 hypothetical protein BO87DRAFT_85776 [Aspergillus neoniger CBS 115656]